MSLSNQHLSAFSFHFHSIFTAEIEELRQRVENSERENHSLKFDLQTKVEEIERLQKEINRLKEQMQNEQDWRDKVQKQLEEIQAVKEKTNQERLNTMTRVSDRVQT